MALIERVIMFYEFLNIRDEQSPFNNIYVRADSESLAEKKLVKYRIFSEFDVYVDVDHDNAFGKTQDVYENLDRAKWFSYNDPNSSESKNILNEILARQFTVLCLLKEWYPDIKPFSGKSVLLIDGFDIYVFNRKTFLFEHYVLNLEFHNIVELLNKMEGN